MKFQVFNPYDQSLISELELSTEEQVLEKLNQASLLHQDQPQGLVAHERISILNKLSNQLQVRQEEFVQMACQEGGKPINDTRVEIQRAIQGIELAASSITQLKGEQVPMDLTAAGSNHTAWTQLEPIGVVVAISAFNHPLNLIVHQVITAVAAGCPVIVKPSLLTPLSCIALVNLLHEVGLPPEWAQVVLCEDSISENLATDSRVNFLTFIGSHKVGWHLRSKVSPGTRIALEHGGIAPAIIESDAMWQQALPGLIKAAFYHAGQVCVSLQRLFVHEDIYQEFRSELIQKIKLLEVGDPTLTSTDIGPFIQTKELNRVHDWVQSAQKEGATITLGGQALSETCYPATLIENASLSSQVSQSEIFGPVLCLYKYSDLEEAIQISNDTQMHFQSSIYTQDIQKALTSAQSLNANSVMINQHPAFRVDWMPFGGRDLSGLSIGGILQSMKDMSKEKLIVIQHLGK